MKLNRIDTSAWNHHDHDWVTEREASWQHIESMLGMYKNTKLKKQMQPIKDYYLKGKTPDWKEYNNWDNSQRHLDLFLFLWLHPTWDKSVLLQLFQDYVTSELIHPRDIIVGFYVFVDSQMILPTLPYESMEQMECPYLEGRGPLLFEVMFSDLEFVKECIVNRLERPEFWGRPEYHFPTGSGFRRLNEMGEWLLLENLLPVQKEWLLQHEDTLDWWYNGCSKEPGYFLKGGEGRQFIGLIELALYRIFHFDTIKEGDTCRTQFALNIRKMFDELEFIPDFKQIWLEVKTGKIIVDNAWEL